MKILVYKTNEKEQEAVQQYVLANAVIEVLDDAKELETIINSSPNFRLALVIPDAEQQILDEWKTKIKNEYPQVTLIELDPGISWQTSMKNFLEAPGSDEGSLAAVELDLDETVNTENIEFIVGNETKDPDINAGELKFEASAVMDSSVTSPTILQLDKDTDFSEEVDETDDLSDNGLDFGDDDHDKTQVISLSELNDNLENNNEEDESAASGDNGIDFGDDDLSSDLGFLSDEEVLEQPEQEAENPTDSGGLSFDDSHEIAGLSLDNNHDFNDEVEVEAASDINEIEASDLSGLSLADEDHEEAIDEDEIDISVDDLGIDDLSLSDDEIEDEEDLSLSGASLDDASDELLSLDEEKLEEIEELSMLDNSNDEEEIEDDEPEELLSFSESENESLEIDDTEIKDIALTEMGEDLQEEVEEIADDGLDVFGDMTLGGNALGQKLLSDDQLEGYIENEVEPESTTTSKLSFENLDEDDEDDIDESDFSIKDVEAVLGESTSIEVEDEGSLSMLEEESEEVEPNIAIIEEKVPEEPVVEKTEIDSEKLEEFSETIRDLREDRERLLSKIEEYEIGKEETKREHLTIEAQLDEKKIEISLAKKRFAEEYEKLNSKINELKSREYEGLDKNKELHSKIEQLNKKAYLDLRKIQQREKELESQLGLLKTDTENQVRNRDIIILDLKRKIDVLEFDIEQAWKQEKAAKREKLILQSKIDRLVSSLKEVVEALHGDDIKQWLDKVHEDDKDKP